jgi:hypothetical protein
MNLSIEGRRETEWNSLLVVLAGCRFLELCRTL